MEVAIVAALPPKMNPDHKRVGNGPPARGGSPCYCDESTRSFLSGPGPALLDLLDPGSHPLLERRFQFCLIILRLKILDRFAGFIQRNEVTRNLRCQVLGADEINQGTPGNSLKPRRFAVCPPAHIDEGREEKMTITFKPQNVA